MHYFGNGSKFQFLGNLQQLLFAKNRNMSPEFLMLFFFIEKGLIRRKNHIKSEFGCFNKFYFIIVN